MSQLRGLDIRLDPKILFGRPRLQEKSGHRLNENCSWLITHDEGHSVGGRHVSIVEEQKRVRGFAAERSQPGIDMTLRLQPGVDNNFAIIVGKRGVSAWAPNAQIFAAANGGAHAARSFTPFEARQHVTLVGLNNSSRLPITRSEVGWNEGNTKLSTRACRPPASYGNAMGQSKRRLVSRQRGGTKKMAFPRRRFLEIFEEIAPWNAAELFRRVDVAALPLFPKRIKLTVWGLINVGVSGPQHWLRLLKEE